MSRTSSRDLASAAARVRPRRPARPRPACRRSRCSTRPGPPSPLPRRARRESPSAPSRPMPVSRMPIAERPNDCGQRRRRGGWPRGRSRRPPAPASSRMRPCGVHAHLVRRPAPGRPRPAGPARPPRPARTGRRVSPGQPLGQPGGEAGRDVLRPRGSGRKWRRELAQDLGQHRRPAGARRRWPPGAGAAAAARRGGRPRPAVDDLHLRHQAQRGPAAPARDGLGGVAGSGRLGQHREGARPDGRRSSCAASCPRKLAAHEHDRRGHRGHDPPRRLQARPCAACGRP